MVGTGGGFPDLETWRTLREMAEDLFASGLLPDHITTPHAALALMEKGRELGVPPMAALYHLRVVEGQIECDAELLLALILRDHGDRAVIFQRTSTTRYVIHYKRRTWPAYRTYAVSVPEKPRTATSPNMPSGWPYSAALQRALITIARFAFADTLAGIAVPGIQGAPTEPTTPQPDLVLQDHELAADTTSSANETPTEPPSDSSSAPTGAQDSSPAQPVEKSARSRADAVRRALERLSKETGVSVNYMLQWLQARYTISDLAKVTNEQLLELRDVVGRMTLVKHVVTG